MSGSSAPFSAVSCSLEIYPFEGGSYILQHGQIRHIVTEKNIRGVSVGRATIQLAPGGPFGPESSPTWDEIMTPMSFVLIAMTRGGRSALVFAGVVIQSGELQEWRTTEQGAMAGRFPTFECADFTWFFRSFQWYSLTFFGLTAGAAVGNAMGFEPAGIPALIDQGLVGGTGTSQSNPSAVAQRWYDKVMAGQGAILGKTFIPYATDNRIMFHDILATLWENFPNAYIPYVDYFLAAEQTWADKFMAMLPMPWYEFFITTAPRDFYTLSQGSSGTTAPGWIFTLAGQPTAQPAGPQLVARVNPAPALQINGTSFGELDMSRWNALPLNQIDTNDPNSLPSFYESRITFSAENAKNFYLLNPTAYNTLYGENNANLTPFLFGYIGAADPASVHRYGYHPAIGSFRWFSDATGIAAQQPGLNIPQSIATMLGKFVSWLHPEPLMAKAEISMPLTPDIMVGTLWRYAPFKDGVLWDFYIEGVRHEFVFGGHSTTSLSLTRGLPTDVYADSSTGGLLYAIMTGNAMRQAGVYTQGLPQGTAPGLTLFNTPESVRSVMGDLARIFVSPQQS